MNFLRVVFHSPFSVNLLLLLLLFLLLLSACAWILPEYCLACKNFLLIIILLLHRRRVSFTRHSYTLLRLFNNEHNLLRLPPLHHNNSSRT